MSQQWYSIVEYARAFSISDMTVRRRIKTGKLNAVLREGKYFIPVEEANQQASPPPVQTPQHRPAITRTSANQESTRSHINESYSSQRSYTPQSETYRESRPKVTAKNIPDSVVRPISRAENLVMKADALIGFCDKMVNDLQEYKVQNREFYESKIQALNTQIEAKNAEVTNYRQQVEDLQVLVKILENKK
ncbi:hypothetical protein N9D31_03785 [Oligoflexaceae bacterium]|nr:hypothetical protein [Oligoflexaceae bacterium]